MGGISAGKVRHSGLVFLCTLLLIRYQFQRLDAVSDRLRRLLRASRHRYQRHRRYHRRHRREPPAEEERQRPDHGQPNGVVRRRPRVQRPRDAPEPGPPDCGEEGSQFGEEKGEKKRGKKQIFANETFAGNKELTFARGLQMLEKCKKYKMN